MCGRYVLNARERLIQAAFPELAEEDLPEGTPTRRFNVAPTQQMPIILREGEETQLKLLRWGLTPKWAKSKSQLLINAKAETLAEKPTFRTLFASSRCIVPATGFYEWKGGKDDKVPYLITVTDRPVFGFAGLYDTGHYVIVTCGPNKVMKPIHNRMPAILEAEHHAAWLDPNLDDPDKLDALLGPYPADKMEARPVSDRVNSVSNDSPELLEPAHA
jgi:putative SOS response-associated peptidase YedK